MYVDQTFATYLPVHILNFYTFLVGGSGKDSLKGGKGDDIYLFEKGDGIDVIKNSDAQDTATDTIRFGASVAEEDISLSRDGDDLIIDSTHGDSIKVENHFAIADAEIDIIEFDNGEGAQWDQATIDSLIAQPESSATESSSDNDVEKLIAAIASFDAGDDGVVNQEAHTQLVTPTIEAV